MHDPETAHKPVAAVAKELGYSPNTIRNVLADAEHKRGLIEGRERGKPGFRLTDAGFRALAGTVVEQTRARERKGQHGED